MSDMGGIKALALEAHCRTEGRAFVRFDYFGHGESSGAFTAGTIRHSNTFLRSVIHKVITHLQGWRRPTDARDNTLEVCAKTQGERHCQNFRRLRRAEVTSSLRSQNTIFFRLAALAGPYFIEFDEIDHLFGFWVGVLINSLN